MEPIFAVEEQPVGISGKTSWPDHLDEKPSKVALQTWCNTWYEDLSSIGYSSLLCGEEPFELQKLKPRDLLAVPRVAGAWVPGVAAMRQSMLPHRHRP